MRMHHQHPRGVPAAIKAIVFALACTPYLCSSLEDARTDIATPTAPPTSTPAALVTQETPTAIENTLPPTPAPSNQLGANTPFTSATPAPTLANGIPTATPGTPDTSFPTATPTPTPTTWTDDSIMTATPTPLPLNPNMISNLSDVDAVIAWVEQQSLNTSSDSAQEDLEQLFSMLINWYYAQPDDELVSYELVFLEAIIKSVISPITASNDTVRFTEDMARDLQSIIASHASRAPDLELAEQGWIFATNVAEFLLAKSVPGFTKSLIYSEATETKAGLGIAVARVSPETPEAETRIGLSGALQMSLPNESLRNATGPVDVIILESINDANADALVDVGDKRDGIMSGVIRLTATLSGTEQPVKLDFRRHPVKFRQLFWSKYSLRNKDRVHCMAWDPVKDSYSTQFCLTRPIYIPPNTKIEWNPAYRVPEPYGTGGHLSDDYEPPYFVHGFDDDGNLRDCRTKVWSYQRVLSTLDGYPDLVVMRSLPNPADQSQQMFGAIVFEGTDCPWILPNRDRGNKLKATTECIWDIRTQSFAGPSCVEEDHEFGGTKSVQHCMCSTMSSYRVFSKPTIENVTATAKIFRRAIVEGLQESVIIGGSVGVMILLSSGTILAWICSRYWQGKTRDRFLLRFVQPEMGFQIMDTLGIPSDSAESPRSPVKKLIRRTVSHLPELDTGQHSFKSTMSRMSLKSEQSGKMASVSAGQILDGSSCKVWTWDMATSSFAIILDDLEEFVKLSEDQRRTFPLFTSSVVHLSAIAGLPPNRIIAAIPNASHLSWKPRDHRVALDVSEEHWINQCLGTSMMMAFLQVRDIISDTIAEEQLDIQSRYFDGCNPVGFRELVLRWKVMLDEDNLYAQGWHDRAIVWKVLWLQRFDGLWDNNEDFATAIGAQNDVLVPVVSLPGNPVGENSIKDSMPTALMELCGRNKELAMRIWCSALALSFLGQMEAMYECFTGWEPDGSNDGFSATVLARLALQQALETASYKSTETKKREQPDLDNLRDNILVEAHQVIRSFRILATTRIEREMTDHLVPILAQKNKTLNPQRKRGQPAKNARHITQQELIALKTDLQRQKLVRDWKWASGQRGDRRPNAIERIQASIQNSCYNIARSFIKNHGVFRILWPSPMDDFSQDERMVVFVCTLTCLFGFNVFFHAVGNDECCAQLREAEGVQGCKEYNGTQFNVDYPVESCSINYQTMAQGPPLGIVVTTETTEVLSGEAGRYFCFVLRQDVRKHSEWECDMIMNPLTPVGKLIIALVSCALVTPIKVLLRMLFSFDDIKFDAAFWKKAEESWTQKLLEFLNVAKKDSASAREAQTEEELAYVRDQRDAYLSNIYDADGGDGTRAQSSKPPSLVVGFADNDDAGAPGRTTPGRSDSFQDMEPVDGYRQTDEVADVDLASNPGGSFSQGIEGEDTPDDQAKLLGGVLSRSFSVAAPRASVSSTHQHCRSAERAGASAQLRIAVPTQQQQEEEEEEDAARDDSDSRSLAPSSTYESSSNPPTLRMASSRSADSPSTIRKQDLLANRRKRLPATNGAGATPLIAPSFSRLSGRNSTRSLLSNPSPKKKHPQK